MKPGLKPLLLAALLGMCTPLLAQNYPSKPIRLVIPYAPAASTDIIGRAVSTRLGDSLGQPVLIDNRPGAGGTIAGQFVAKAPPDGYTLIFSGSQFAQLAVFISGLQYDPINDFVSISTLAEIPIAIIAGSGTPFRNLSDLIAAAKKDPGKHSFGTPGVGTSAHLTCEILKFRAGIDLLHVPYKGNAPAATDLLGGQIPLLCSNIAGALPFAKGGKMRFLAVTGGSRDGNIPDVQTFREAGVEGLDRGTWMAISAPARTPAAIVTRLSRDINASLKSKEVIDQFTAAGAVAMISTPEEFTQRLVQLRDQFAEFRKRTGFKLE
jgi:tripartite-type tricarboxylate transporter receptor subunit TctC